MMILSRSAVLRHVQVRSRGWSRLLGAVRLASAEGALVLFSAISYARGRGSPVLRLGIFVPGGRSPPREKKERTSGREFD